MFSLIFFLAFDHIPCRRCTTGYRLTYYDYQSIKAQCSFGDEVLDLKLWCCFGQLSSFPMVTIASPAILHALLPVT